MIDRVDLLIAVVGITVSIVGSSTALWMALSKKADKEDLVRLEDRLGSRFDGVEARLTRMDTRFEGVEARLTRMDTRFEGVEARLTRMDSRIESLDMRSARTDAKLDALILHLVGPERLPPPGDTGTGPA